MNKKFICPLGMLLFNGTCAAFRLARHIMKGSMQYGTQKIIRQRSKISSRSCRKIPITGRARQRLGVRLYENRPE